MEGSVVEHLEKAPLTRFHYGLLLIGSLIYGFTAMNVMLIAAVLTPIRRVRTGAPYIRSPSERWLPRHVLWCVVLRHPS